MAHIRDIKTRISNVSTIEKVTQSIKGMSTSKLSSTKLLVESSKDYFMTSNNITQSLINVFKFNYAHLEIFEKTGLDKICNSFLSKEKKLKKLIIFIESDRGLCGSYNNNINKVLSKKILKLGTDHIVLFPIGLKAYNFMKLLKPKYFVDYYVSSDLSNINDQILEKIFFFIEDLFAQNEIDSVLVCYTKSRSVISHEVIVEDLFYMQEHREILDNNEGNIKEQLPLITDEKDFIEIIPTVLKYYVINKLMEILLQSALSEHSTRLQAIDAANQNAKDLKKILNVKYNRTRQDMITNELLEIISGAEALNNSNKGV